MKYANPIAQMKSREYPLQALNVELCIVKRVRARWDKNYNPFTEEEEEIEETEEHHY